MYLDACFTGTSDGGRLVEGSVVYETPAYPEEVTDTMMILTAVKGTQIARWDREAEHGLFTDHLLDALYGGGDSDGDGEVTAGEVKLYLDRYMSAQAWTLHRKTQEAVLTTRASHSDLVLASAGRGGAFPMRPNLEGPAPDPVPDGTVGKIAREEGGDPVPEPVVKIALKGAKAEEAALKIKRADRILVQHALENLGFSPGPLDGLFGGKTRDSLGAWQKSRELDVTGYLTREQLEYLVTKAQEVKEDRVAAARRLDDATFEGAKRLNTRASYRAYLNRDGTRRHEAEARALLAKLQEEEQRQAADLERQRKEAEERRLREEAEKMQVEEFSSPAAQQLSKILRRRFFPNEVDENGWTDLHYAAILDLAEVAKALMVAGANPDAKTKSDGEPFRGRLVQAVREFGRSIDEWKRIGLTPLAIAAAYNAGETTAELVSGGGAVNAKFSGDWTPLHFAASNNAQSAAAELIGGLADVNSKTLHGETPLHMAARDNAVSVTMELVSHGADIDSKNHDGDTPLHYAAKHSAREVLEFLIGQGANHNARNKNGHTPLFSAAEADAVAAAVELVSSGASVSETGKRDTTPLHSAAARNALKVAEYLIMQGGECQCNKNQW